MLHNCLSNCITIPKILVLRVTRVDNNLVKAPDGQGILRF